MARGLTNAEIGRELAVTEGIVKYRCMRLYEVIGVHNRVQAAAYSSRLPARRPGHG
ncbi:LuxR C-terminal-related transcriptional regulator [Streptomyces sp. SID12501]|uniref:LuxR C-terminal-related transcriptional regulator n=1 Tax=Streptomyces sp. SID12501 TaxID=2706042 RepID=UPI0034E07FC4